MRNGRSAKLNRRVTALENLKKSLQAWKDAKTEEEIWELLSTKNRKMVEDSPHDRAVILKEVRRLKIQLSEERIETLEGLVR